MKVFKELSPSAMKCVFVILISLIIGSAKIDYAQIAIHPYVGGSLSFFGVSVFPGWGLDGGIKFKSGYAGLEYGLYGYKIQTFSPLEGETVYPAFEKFFGLHGGVNVDSSLSVGPVLLYSEEHQFDGTVSHHFDFGPDVRLHDKKHLMLGIAYTRRRGINPSLNVLF
jgi:hypothetical protein